MVSSSINYQLSIVNCHLLNCSSKINASQRHCTLSTLQASLPGLRLTGYPSRLESAASWSSRALSTICTWSTLHEAELLALTGFRFSMPSLDS